MEDKKAAIWDKRNSGEGEPYKKYVTDPLFLELLGPIEGKIILDQGCGNGHLSKKIAAKNPEKIILMDLYQGNLECAQRNLAPILGNFEFLQCDLNGPISYPSNSIDSVVSSFVLSEIENISLIIQETFRLLKNGGSYIIAITHPIYDLEHYLSEKFTGAVSKKIRPTGNYFDEYRSFFIFGADTHEKIEAPHFHRKIQDYFLILRKAGFFIDQLLEPAINDALIKDAPRFEGDKDYPVSLVIKAIKVI